MTHTAPSSVLRENSQPKGKHVATNSKHSEELAEFFHTKIAEVFTSRVSVWENGSGSPYFSVKDALNSKKVRQLGLFLYKRSDGRYGLIRTNTVGNFTNLAYSKLETKIARLHTQLNPSQMAELNAHLKEEKATTDRFISQHFTRVTRNMLPVLPSKPKSSSKKEKVLVSLPTGLSVVQKQQLLLEFHICGRKVSYAFESDAKKNVPDSTMHTYVCLYCSGYHIGHMRKDNSLETYVFRDRHESSWVGYNKRANRFLREKNLVNKKGDTP